MAFHAQAILTTDMLRRELRDTALAGDYVRLLTGGDHLNLNSEGRLLEANVNLGEEDESLLSLEAGKPSRASYSLSYLTDMVKAAKSTSDVVSIQFSTDNPLKLDFKQSFHGKLIYYLAPRTETE